MSWAKNKERKGLGYELKSFPELLCIILKLSCRGLERNIYSERLAE